MLSLLKSTSPEIPSNSYGNFTLANSKLFLFPFRSLLYNFALDKSKPCFKFVTSVLKSETLNLFQNNSQRAK